MRMPLSAPAAYIVWDVSARMVRSWDVAAIMVASITAASIVDIDAEQTEGDAERFGITSTLYCTKGQCSP